MTNCPCCDNQMLRHIRGQHLYWFCRSCWQEMPALEANNCKDFLGSRLTRGLCRKNRLMVR
ncbi:hypothetical protein B7486_51130 [cyanobacterium TDX16]|nr:hypothetical protein B7486_51130 [cyanobacterium TDX16]